jgi:hypothetical protein
MRRLPRVRGACRRTPGHPSVAAQCWPSASCAPVAEPPRTSVDETLAPAANIDNNRKEHDGFSPILMKRFQFIRQPKTLSKTDREWWRLWLLTLMFTFGCGNQMNNMAVCSNMNRTYLDTDCNYVSETG